MKHRARKRPNPPVQLTDEQRQLVEDHLSLVGFVLNRFGAQGLDLSDDTYQTGMMGLLNAAAGYQRDRAQFSTFAVHCIINELRTESAKTQRTRHCSDGKPCSLDKVFHHNDVDLCALIDTIPDETIDLDGPINYAQTKAFIHKTLARFHPQHAEMVEDYLFRGMKQHAIAARYGCTQECVSKVLQSGLKLLRRHMRRAGYER